MSESTALATREPSMMELLSMAVEKGAGIETIERLAKLKRELAEDEAKLEFNQAMHRAQEQMRRIGVNAMNPQTHSKYATYEKLDSALRPIYVKEGFSLSFDSEPTDRPDVVRVVCYVSRGVYTRTYRIDMPADGKGAKGNDVMSRTHATGAAMSYGARYLLKAIFNVAVGETDDDGNLASGPVLAPDVLEEWLDVIKSASDEDELKQQYFNALEAAKPDQNAIKALAHAKNERWRQIAKGGRK